MKCRICASDETRLVYRTERCPRASHKFARAPERGSWVTLAVYECERCGTAQLEHPYEEEYADDYQRNASFSPAALAFMRENVEALAAHLPPGRGARVLEVGCGDGSFLAMLAERYDAVGVEPSRAASQLAAARGLAVRNEYFDPAAFGAEFDAVVLRFVLEHIFDVNPFVEGLARVVKPGGYCALEVPNYAVMAREGRFFDFYREHTFYFDAATLCALMRRHGFEVARLRTFMNDDYLHGVFRHVGRPAASFAARDAEVTAAFRRMFEEPGLGRVACWGASGSGVNLLGSSGLDAARVEFVIDSDPNKHGQYFYGSGARIVGPAVLDERPFDAVIILSTTYENEIAATLRDRYKFRGRIGSIRGTPHWLADPA